MTRQEFVNLAAAIKTYYPRDDVFPTKESISLWYDLLCDLDYRRTGEAIKAYVRTHRFPPTICDIRNQYKEQLIKEAKRSREIRRLYEKTVANYPNANQEEGTWEAFTDVLKRKGKDELGTAKWILRNTEHFVREWERGSDTTIPTLTDYLKGIHRHERLC